MGNCEWTPVVIIRICCLPEQVRGCTCLDHDGNYNVYVNEKYLHQASDILNHEIAHIRDGHFYSLRELSELEAEAERSVVTCEDLQRIDIRAC